MSLFFFCASELSGKEKLFQRIQFEFKRNEKNELCSKVQNQTVVDTGCGELLLIFSLVVIIAF